MLAHPFDLHKQIGEAYKDADPFSPSWEEAPPYPRPSPQPPRNKK